MVLCSPLHTRTGVMHMLATANYLRTFLQHVAHIRWTEESHVAAGIVLSSCCRARQHAVPRCKSPEQLVSSRLPVFHEPRPWVADSSTRDERGSGKMIAVGIKAGSHSTSLVKPVWHN